MAKRNKKLVIVSGGFDPIHLGHLRMFENAAKLGSLTVVINSDDWLRRKKGAYFMSESERAEIISAFKCVDNVYILKSVKPDVCKAIEELKPDIFANGGDRKNEDDLPEAELCNKMGVKMVFNIGSSNK